MCLAGQLWSFEVISEIFRSNFSFSSTFRVTSGLLWEKIMDRLVWKLNKYLSSSQFWYLLRGFRKNTSIGQTFSVVDKLLSQLSCLHNRLQFVATSQKSSLIKYCYSKPDTTMVIAPVGLSWNFYKLRHLCGRVKRRSCCNFRRLSAKFLHLNLRKFCLFRFTCRFNITFFNTFFRERIVWIEWQLGNFGFKDKRRRKTAQKYTTLQELPQPSWKYRARTTVIKQQEQQTWQTSAERVEQRAQGVVKMVETMTIASCCK